MCRTWAAFSKVSSRRLKTRTPPCTSLWPPKYFVTEWKRHVGSEVERPLEGGRRERVVHDGARADGPRGLRDRRDVRDSQERIRRRLHEDEPRRRRQRPLHGGEVVHRAESRREPPLREELLRDDAPAVVGVVRHEDVRARRQRLQQRHARRHARRERERARAALERRERRPRGASAWGSTRGCTCGRRAVCPPRRARTSWRGREAARPRPWRPRDGAPRAPRAFRTSSHRAGRPCVARFPP